MVEHAVAGAPKFGKNGIHLSAALLKSYGFKEGRASSSLLQKLGKLF
jgi:hypothetical protein